MKNTLPPVAPVSLPVTGPEEIKEIIASIARIYAIPSPELLTNATRQKSRLIAEARAVCAWVLYKCCAAVLNRIQERLGFHAHSAVLRCIQSVDDCAAVDADYRQRLEAVLFTLSKNKKTDS